MRFFSFCIPIMQVWHDTLNPQQGECQIAERSSSSRFDKTSHSIYRWFLFGNRSVRKRNRVIHGHIVGSQYLRLGNVRVVGENLFDQDASLLTLSILVFLPEHGINRRRHSVELSARDSFGSRQMAADKLRLRIAPMRKARFISNRYCLT